MRIKSKYLLPAAMLALMATVVSCKSSEQNYRAAYDRVLAKQKDMEGVSEETYSRIEAERNRYTSVIDGDSVRMVREKVNIVDGNASDVKPYSVVVGEYKQLFNARSFRERLKKEGQPAYVVLNGESMYFVVSHGFDTAIEAAGYLKGVRDTIQMKIPIERPWILAKP